MELTGGAVDRQTLRDIQMLRLSVDALRLAIDAVTVTTAAGDKAIRVLQSQG